MATDALVPPPPTPDPTPGLSEPARIIDTFIAPSKTFTDIRRNAWWWGPVVVMILISVFYAWSVDSKITFRRAVDNQIALSPKAQERMEKLPADQREKALDMQASITRVISYCFTLLLLLFNLIFAALLFAYFKIMANATLKFKHMWAVSMYASLAGGLKFLLAGLMIMLGVVQADGFNINNPIATNLGYLLDPAGNKMLFAIGSALDVFSLWSIVLIAIGISCVCNVKPKAAYIGVFGVFLVWVLFTSSLALLG